MSESTKVTVDLADIIGKAAQSILGVLSLLCLIVGLIAYAFFSKSRDRIKLFVFLTILAAAVSFGAAVLVQSRKEEKSAQAAQSSSAPAQGPVQGASATNSSAEVPGAQPEQTIFVKRVTGEGDEPSDCATKRTKSRLISGSVDSVFQIEFPATRCKVRLYYDVQATRTFDAPFQIVLFDVDEEGNGSQILTATVNKLPNKFEIVVGEANPGRWLKMVTTTPSESGAEAEKKKPTLIGTVEIGS